MALICKLCGYKQYDDETIKFFKNLHPAKEEHDIPYYCGACLKNASLKEYKVMEKAMRGKIK